MNEFRLFAHGEEFDVDAFLASTTLRPDRVWRRGDRRDALLPASLHPTSGVVFELGDDKTIPFNEQERVALAYIEAHRDGLRELARLPGVDTFILRLVYRAEFERSILGFCIGPSLPLMWRCLDIGCVPDYLIWLERWPDTDGEDAQASGG